MNIKRAKQEIKDTIEAYLMKDEFGGYAIPAIRQRPVLLIGPPGVGKTQIMEQISQECQIGLVAYTITHHTRQSAVGLPFIEHKNYGGKEYAVTEYTMSEIVGSIYDKIEQTGLKEGILFIDEINCVSETLAPTMLQFLQGKTFGSHKIPEGWIIVAAGNPPEYNKSVREFDVVTLDRIRRIEVEPDYPTWKEYAVKMNIHPAIRSYLDIRKDSFCRIETTVDGKHFATPRGWEDLSQLVEIYEKLGKTVDRDVVGEYIQFPKIAKDFANYLELYYKYRNDYQIEAVLSGVQLPESTFDKLAKAPFDERVSVVGLLLAGVNDRFRTVCQRGEMMELRMELLKGLQKEGVFAADKSGSEAIEAYEQMAEKFAAEQKQKKESGLLSRLEERRGRAAIARMEQDLSVIRGRDFADASAVWECQRELFAADSDAYEDEIEAAGQCLEYAFNFMEGAFADGQEMVLFVTELNTGFYSVKFLQEYECERYYEYNQNLLFSTEEDAVREAIADRR
jgi:hypothetical protein